MALFSPISQVKILVPQRRKELLSRPRLLGLLDDLLDFKLIIIAAPAGYGKTSLMIDYATSYDWPVAWLALDPLDQNPTRFLTYFITSIQQCFPEFGAKSIAAMKSQREEQLNIDYIVTSITNDIYENITEHFILVLDDYHLVNQGKEIDEFLSNFLQKVSENFHLVVTSRTLLTLPDLPLLVARSQVGGLSLEELVFQPDEIRKFFEKNNKIEISNEDAEMYARQSEGWITGLLLTTQINTKSIGDHSKVTRASGIGLYEYLAQQVLDQQNSEIQDFLLWTSLLEEFNPEMCERIIEPAVQKKLNWQELMESIIFNNLFVVRVGEEGLWLRYHHLFRDFLQHRLESLYPETAQAILTKLAEYNISTQDWERVFVIYSQMGDINSLIALLEEQASSFIAKGKINQLSDWFSYVPDERILDNPRLLSLKATIEVNRGNLPQGLELLNAAIDLQQQTESDNEFIAENLVRRSTTLRVLGKYQDSLDDARHALDLCKSIKKKTPTRAEAMRAIGINYYLQGILNDALTWMKNSLNAYQEIGLDEDCARIMVELGAIQETLGFLEDAEKTYHTSLQLWDKLGDSIWQSNLYNNLGVLQHAKGDFENSFLNLEKAMSFAKIRGNRRDEGYALASIGDLYKDLDAHEEAMDAYTQALESAQNNNDQYLVLYLRLAQTRIKTLQKQLKQATTFLDIAYTQAKKSGTQLELEQCKVEKAILKYYYGDLENALDLLKEIRDYFSNSGQSDTLFTIEIYLVLVLLKQKQIDEAQGLLDHLIKQSSTSSANTHLLAICFEVRNDIKSFSGLASVAEQIDFLNEHNLAYQKKIQNVRRRIRKHASVVPFAAPKLIIRGFGKTEVYQNNRLITTSDWMTQTSRDLFFLFLSNPEGMTKEEVGLILWPDSSTEELKRRFKNAIYRMRRAIGSSAVVFNDNYYRFNNSLDFEYDVLSFEQNITQAEKESNTERKIKLLETAIELYKGPFLVDIDATWFSAERQRYFNIYLETLRKLYDIYLDRNELEKALEISRLIIKNEPFNEEAYRNAMAIYHEFGNTAAIIRLFEQCKQQLAREYGLEPSEETVRYFNTLIQPAR